MAKSPAAWSQRRSDTTGTRILAYCGLLCNRCPAYIATQTGDRDLLRGTAVRWSSDQFKIEPEDILCDGCFGRGARITKFCSMCGVRACAIGRAVVNCGVCADYPCERLEQHWATCKCRDEAKPVLDAERAGGVE